MEHFFVDLKLYGQNKQTMLLYTRIAFLPCIRFADGKQRSVMSGQLFVRYTHIDPGHLPHESHVNGPWIEIDIVDPETHAKTAPTEAEWFEYFSQPHSEAAYTPLEDVPTYFLDTTPENYGSQPSIQRVALRNSRMSMPFYPEQPTRNAVISSR